ncbi:unnamed protein product [Rotaria sp. Silwood1]|nr:unnamed protein product [Rotaria sp. Silwood1]
MTLQNLLNTNHLRTLTFGIHTSRFLERLLLCIPLIENLSFGIRDRDIKANTLISGSLIISGDIIQQLCIDRLKPMATYSLNLLLYVEHDLEEKIIFNSFFQVAFTQRQKPRVFIQECNDSDISSRYHCFMVYTLPYNDIILLSNMFSTDLEKSCQMSTDVTNLFPRANTLSLCGYKKVNGVRDLGKPGCSISSLVPWSLLTHIEINHSDVITQHTLQSLLRIAYHVHTLEIIDERGILLRTILHNKDNFGTHINQQTLAFTICDSYRHWQWKPSRMNDGKNKGTKRIVNLIYLLVNDLQQLVWLRISFCNLFNSDTPCFPH